MRHALAYALSALILFAGGSAWLALYPGLPPDLAGAHDYDRDAVKVRIPLPDGDALDGWLLPGPRRAVILMFAGYGRDHHRMWRYAQFLRRDGCTILAADFRSGRRANRRPTTLGHYEREDAEAALAFVERDPRTRGAAIGLFGESLAGSVALATAADHPELDAVVADCPFATGRMAVEDAFTCVLHLPARPLADVAVALAHAVTGCDPTALDATLALRRLDRRPVLLLQTGLGDRFSQDEVRALEDAAGPGTEGWTVADCRHNELWLAHRPEYEARVRAFFAEHLLHAAIWRVESAPVAARGPGGAAPR